MASLDAYQRTVERLLAQQDRLTDQQVRALFAVLSDARRRTLDELTRLASIDGFKASQLTTLRAAIDRQALDLMQQYRGVMTTAINTAWDQGSSLATQTLQAASIDLVPSREVSRNQLAVAQQVAGDMVTQVGETFRAQAKQAITRGVLGELPPMKVMQDVASLLKTQPGRIDKRLGSVTVQAERIVRTEMAGVSNIANQQRHEAIAADVPGMQKYWHSAEDRRVRPDHRTATSRYRPGGETGPIAFEALYVVGNERARFPHDPRLSAKERVNCRCISVMYRPEWFQD